MSEMTRYRLSDLYELSSGISTKPAQAGHGYPFCSFSTVFNNSFLPDELPDLMDTSDQERIVYSIKAGDVFLTRTSETVDELGMSSVAVKDYPNATYSGFLKRLRPISDKAYPKYMAMFFRGEYFRKTVTNKAVMTLRASFNEDIFNDISVELPPIEVQRFVGDLFYDIECHSRNNNAICSNLEAMAKLLYDYWFVQFDFPDENGKPYKSSGGKMVWNDELKREIPAGWGVGTLYDISNVVWGQCPDGKDILDRDTVDQNTLDYCSGAGDMRGGFIVDCQAKTYTNTSRRMAHKGAVLMSVAGSIGAICIADHDISLGRAAVAFESCSEKHNMFIFNVLIMLAQQVQRIATGSIQKVINSDHLDSMKFAYNQAILDLYGEKTFSIYNQLLNEAFENQQLASLRDFLLPMLMNGQVKVGA